MGNYWGTNQGNSSIAYYLLGAHKSGETLHSVVMLDLLWVKVLLTIPVASESIVHRGTHGEKTDFIAGFECASKSWQAKTEDGESDESSIHCSHNFILTSLVIEQVKDTR